MNKIGSIMVTIILLLLGLVFLEQPLTDVLTDTGTAEATGTSTVTLPSPHWYTSTEGISATNDGAAATIASISDDRLSVTINGTVATDKKAVVTYLRETEDSIENIVLKAFPFLVTAVMLAVAFSTVRGGITRYRSGGEASVPTGTAILVIIGGVILLPIIMAFRDEAVAAFGGAPEYIGVAIAMPLVILGYIFALFGIAIQSLGPTARDMMS